MCQKSFEFHFATVLTECNFGNRGGVLQCLDGPFAKCGCADDADPVCFGVFGG